MLETDQIANYNDYYIGDYLLILVWCFAYGVLFLRAAKLLLNIAIGIYDRQR